MLHGNQPGVMNQISPGRMQSARRFPWSPQLRAAFRCGAAGGLLGCAFLLVACESDDPGGPAGPDAGAVADVGVPGMAEAGSMADLVAAGVAGGDGGPAGDAGVADAGAGDSGAAAFMAITPCLTRESYVTGPTSVAASGTSYSPPCLRVPPGTSVVIEASPVHSLNPRPPGSAGTPIPSQLATTTVVFPNPGFYPYQCPEHADQSMFGVIWVSSEP